MLDLLFVSLFQMAAGEAATSLDQSPAAEETATPSQVTQSPPATADTPRQRVCRNVVSGQSRLGASRRRDCNRGSDAARTDRDQDAMRDATARAAAPRDPGS